MPTKDREKRRKSQREWIQRNLKQGYGKWIYARRKLIRDEREIFHETLSEIAKAESIDAARLLASKSLSASQKRWKKLGTWTGTRVSQQVKSDVSPDPEKSNR